MTEHALYWHDYCLDCGVKASEIGKELLLWNYMSRDSHLCVFCILTRQHPHQKEVYKGMREDAKRVFKIFHTQEGQG